MSPSESQLLQEFLDQLVQVRGVAKDPEADAMIERAVARQPDAAYLLVQRALLQQQALENAKAEIAALQNQLRPAQPAFLDPNAWGNSGRSRPADAAPAAPMYRQPDQQPYPPAYQPAYPQAQASGPGGFLRGGLGGTMGTIAATAAGVAGGAFLFQGIENLLGHHGGNPLGGHQSAMSSPSQDASIDHATDSSSNESLAHKLGADNMFGSGADTGSNTSNGLLGDLGGDFNDTSQDDGLFS